MAAMNRDEELARIDSDWEREREQYRFMGKRGPYYPNSPIVSLFSGMLLVAFAGWWTWLAISMTTPFAATPSFPAFAQWCFPLFGLLFLLVGLAASIGSYRTAVAYQRALSQYQARRAAVLAAREEKEN